MLFYKCKNVVEFAASTLRGEFIRGLILIEGSTKITEPKVICGVSSEKTVFGRRQKNMKTGFFDEKMSYSVIVLELFYAENDTECEPISST